MRKEIFIELTINIWHVWTSNIDIKPKYKGLGNTYGE